MTIKEWMKVLIEKNEHYPISDEFVHGYQQGPGKNSYIAFALQVGKVIKRDIAEPNQKWHFFESYILNLLVDNKMNLECKASKVYSKLRCPELILWLCEASGVDSITLMEASACAKEIIDNGSDNRARNVAGCKIRAMIPWEKIEKALYSSSN